MDTVVNRWRQNKSNTLTAVGSILQDMKNIPTLDEVRAKLAPLTMRQLAKLEELSGVSKHTLYKIRSGEIIEPSLVKVGDFWPHIAAARRKGKS